MANQDKLVGFPLYMVMVLMLITGTCNTVFLKLQDTAMTPTGPNGEMIPYAHAWVQCAVMFAGEFCCLAVYGLKKFYMKRKAQVQSDDDVPLSPGG